MILTGELQKDIPWNDSMEDGKGVYMKFEFEFVLNLYIVRRSNKVTCTSHGRKDPAEHTEPNRLFDLDEPIDTDADSLTVNTKDYRETPSLLSVCM